MPTTNRPSPPATTACSSTPAQAYRIGHGEAASCLARKSGSPDLATRLERAAESGGEAVDAVMREQNAVTCAMQMHEELTRERAAHALTRRSLARAYDTIARMRKVLSMGDAS